MADVDEGMMGDDEAMCQEKVTGRPQCDRSRSEDTTQVEVAWSKREAHGRRRRIKGKRNMTWGKWELNGECGEEHLAGNDKWE
jgi:hypothetical protein